MQTLCLLTIHFNGSKKRSVYFEDLKLKEEWSKKLRQAINQRDVREFYKIDHSMLLGEGSFGQVYKGKSRESGMKVAIKILNKRMLTNVDLDNQRNEVSILRVCNSP